VILVLIQLGGFGIMTLASLAAVAVSHRLGLRGRMLAQAETGALELGEIRRVLVGVAQFTILFEATAAVVLTGAFWLGHGESLVDGIRLGVFHAVSAFNNAGFALFSESLVGYAADPWVSVTIALAVIAGGIGFPVWLDLRRAPRRARRWSLHTKVTLTMTALLLVLGFATYVLFEWDNPGTLGPLDVPGKLVAGFFQGTMPRTAGFTTVDTGLLNEPTQLVTILLMFVGGGSASTAGGVKVATVAVIVLMVWAEVRGDPDVSRFGRRIPPVAQRQALSVVLIGIAALFAGNLLLLVFSPFGLTETLFEATSAFGTVGLSLGITPALGTSAQLVLVVLMFVGRVGPLTLGTALVLREHERLYRFPEERPIVG
jgi:Trk-type K+ transport system membrane component